MPSYLLILAAFRRREVVKLTLLVYFIRYFHAVFCNTFRLECCSYNLRVVQNIEACQKKLCRQKLFVIRSPLAVSRKAFNRRPLSKAMFQFQCVMPTLLVQWLSSVVYFAIKNSCCFRFIELASNQSFPQLAAD